MEETSACTSKKVSSAKHLLWLLKWTDQPWNLTRNLQKNAFETIIQAIVEKGIYTTKYLSSEIGKNTSLKYDFFLKEKSLNLSLSN